MGKPEDIPDDIWDYVLFEVMPSDLIGSAIGNRVHENTCRAMLLAERRERERAAKIAADYGDWTNLTCDQKQFAAVLVAADEIATAIRQNAAPKPENDNFGTVPHQGEIR